jgi:hypothetical protein
VADGVPVWFDENDVVPGDDFVIQMEQGLQRCDYTAVVITPNFLNGPWAQREFRIALEKEASSDRVHVIPVYRATVDTRSFPPFLRTKHYADFRTGFESGYSSLMRGLRELPLRRTMLSGPAG